MKASQFDAASDSDKPIVHLMFRNVNPNHVEFSFMRRCKAVDYSLPSRPQMPGIALICSDADGWSPWSDSYGEADVVGRLNRHERRRKMQQNATVPRSPSQEKRPRTGPSGDKTKLVLSHYDYYARFRKLPTCHVRQWKPLCQPKAKVLPFDNSNYQVSTKRDSPQNIT